MRLIVIRGLPLLYSIFSHYHINGAILGENNIFEHKMCVLTSQQLLRETFLILRVIDVDIKNEYWSFSWRILMKLEFSRQNFEKKNAQI